MVAPRLSADAARAGDELADYAAAGVERLILAPTGADWERGYRLGAGAPSPAARVEVRYPAPVAADVGGAAQCRRSVWHLLQARCERCPLR